ncbi:uncharacterized protein LOC135433371 [Drosophila montana]|uniref:uncharacterized protein LOC135433371 n=1 Tax=Drosophila montana TaxID=40370 RepID=UPI00313DB975
MNLSKERDLTQLYNPPKLPKHKQNPSKPKDNQNEEDAPESAPPSTVSLFDAVKQKAAPSQGKPQLPFRSTEQNIQRVEPMDRTFAEALGIQNLVTQLAAEKVLPPSSEGKELKSEETAKLPRKKLVKTRPVLSTKRSAKAAQSQATAAESKEVEPLLPRKRPLLPESQQRAKTSSTSDDDGDMFHGFDNGASSCKRFKHSEEKETDISDDASPDYDEMEVEPQPDIKLSAKKTKTESVVDNAQTASMHTDAAAVNLEDAQPTELLKEDTLKKKTSKKKSAMQQPELQQKAKRPRTDSAKVKEAKKKPESKWKVKVKNGEPSTECAKEGNVSNAATPEETGMEEPIPVKKKRGRPRKSAVIADSTKTSLSESANLLDSPADSSMRPVAASTPDAKRRGRKTKDIQTADNENISESCRQTNEFYHRLLLTRSRQQLVSGVELREDNVGEGDLQCGLCHARCDKADWRLHLGEHYGVGWLIGEPAPLLSRSSVLKMMKTYLDAGHKRLSCRLCLRSLTSALGMMLHLEGCGIKERMVCENCKGSYTKLSYPAHVRTCTKRRRLLSDEDQATQAAADAEIENSAPVYSNAGRTKRKSTLKAETKLEKIAAQTKELGVDETENSQGFDGVAFDYDLGTQKASSDEDESDGADSSQTDGDHARSSTKKEHKPAQKTLYGRINVKKVMKDRWNHFTETNYAKSILYPHLVPRYEKLSAADTRQLLPSKDSTSMRYAYDTVDDNGWMQLKPMEGFSKEHECILYLGNAIKELAWVPLPSTVETQYLLCSQRNKVLGYSRQFKDKPENALLLLIECKMPPAGDDSAWTLQTRLHYGICVPEGPVHSLAFMASGGYDESINRLGLLAVGGSSGAVIYALPLHLNNETEQADGKELDDVIVLQPLLTLNLDLDNPMQDPCTKICWSESSGHNLLVSGYASGNVAFYDISDEQGLNCIERNNQRHFLPAHFFYFGERNIYNLELHYDTSGARWLAIGTNMRKLWVYDIANWSQPLPISGDTVCNMFMGGLNWSPLWEALAVGCTEVYKSQFPRLLALNPSGISFSHSTLDVVLSSPRGIHFNWEQLTLVAATDNGDVAFLQCNQFNLEMMLQKRTTNCRTVCSTEPCLLSGAPESNTISPEQFKRDYGLILKPLKNVPNDKKSTYINLKRRPSFDLLNLMRFNSVRWNWNEPARNWVVVGAEHGLLRIIKFEEGKHFRFF